MIRLVAFSSTKLVYHPLKASSSRRPTLTFVIPSSTLIITPLESI